jgi:hypothetical protein
MTDTSTDRSLGARIGALADRLSARREAAIFGGALVFGLLVLPFVIWTVGHRTLGPYTHGDDPRGLGPLTLLTDYFSGLGHGWIGYWVVAIGPALLLLALRLWLALLRHFPRD